MDLRKFLLEKDSSFEADIPIPIELRLSHSMSNLKELTSTLSQIDLPERGD
jgi:hypothetical protein